MFKVLSEKFISDYSVLLGEKDKVVESMNIMLTSAFADVDNIRINGKELSDSVKEQLKAELTEEYKEQYPVADIDEKIAFYEQYLEVEVEPETIIETEEITESETTETESVVYEQQPPTFF